MKIYIGADHGGYELKKEIITELSQLFDIVDEGAYELIPTDDYPDYAIPLAQKVVKDTGSFGVLLCRSGQGVCIAANKVDGIRAAECSNEIEARKAREDDNCNVLCLSADYIDLENALRVIKTFLSTEFRKDQVKYQRRVDKIKKFEKVN